MDMFFENRGITGKIAVNRTENHLFPAHFHLELEVFLVKKGKFTLTVNGEKITLCAGEIFVLDSYDVHSYDKQDIADGQDTAVVIIPYQYLSGFNRNRKGFKLKMPIIQDETLCDTLMSLADTYLLSDKSEQVKRSAIDLFLALLSEKLQFSEEKTGEEEVLVRSILAYAQEHYQGEISLSSVARHLGYSEAHLSRAFHKYIKISLPEYVNRLRLEYVSREKSNSPRRKTVDLVYEAGFNSQQSYYRWRKKFK